MVAQTMGSGVPSSVFDEIDAARGLRMIAANHPMAGFTIDLDDTHYPPDFPRSKGPMCVVNCVINSGGGQAWSGSAFASVARSRPQHQITVSAPPA
jgi:hypothetical protein